MRRPLQIGDSLSTFEFGKRVPGGSRYARVDEVPLLRPLDSSYCRIPLAFHIARKPISFDGGFYHEAARPAHAEAAEAAVRNALRRGRFINCGNRNHLAEIRVVKLSTAIILAGLRSGWCRRKPTSRMPIRLALRAGFVGQDRLEAYLPFGFGTSSAAPKYSHRCSAIGTLPFFQTKSWKARRLNFSPCCNRASASNFMI